MTNLDRTWKNCLRMWKWITRVYKPCDSVGYLKGVWLSEHGFDDGIDSDCFFCEYHAVKCKNKNPNRKFQGGSFCRFCPGGYVDKTFDCMLEKHNYGRHPKAFYQELVRLDKKRKQ